jgi:hypothetical protein
MEKSRRVCPSDQVPATDQASISPAIHSHYAGRLRSQRCCTLERSSAYYKKQYKMNRLDAIPNPPYYRVASGVRKCADRRLGVAGLPHKRLHSAPATPQLQHVYGEQTAWRKRRDAVQPQAAQEVVQVQFSARKLARRLRRRLIPAAPRMVVPLHPDPLSCRQKEGRSQGEPGRKRRTSRIQPQRQRWAEPSLRPEGARGIFACLSTLWPIAHRRDAKQPPRFGCHLASCRSCLACSQ